MTDDREQLKDQLLTLTPGGLVWAEAHMDESILARVALGSKTWLDWPLPFRLAAVAAANIAAKEEALCQDQS